MTRPSETRGAAVARVVFDTNVVVSALVFTSGTTARLRGLWQSGRSQPLVSRATIQELVRVLAYPRLRLSANDQQELLADYLPYATAVAVPVPGPDVPPCRDPHDTPFLELAVAGRAHCLVSGDRDLLALHGALAMPVLTMTQWLERMEGEQP